MASLHIISVLKSMSEFELASKFWEWLRQQGKSHCDARVYGSYIELLAYKGEPLAKMEELYAEAFDRYSSTASVSPQIARDTGATHIILLQSIITARLLNGAWRSAYEAFDLVLRLYPTATPARIYELFIYERPIREAFAVFLIACRAGTPPNASVLTPIMEEIWLNHRDVCALIRLCWAYSGAGGAVRSEHLNFLLKALLLSYPSHPSPSATPDELKSHAEGFTKLIASLRALIGCFEPLGIAIQASTFNTIISCGGKLGRGDLVLGALRDMVKAGIRPNDVTYRTLVVVAGHLRDEKQLVEAWRMLEAKKMEERNARIQAQKKLIEMKRLSPDTVVGGVGVKWEFKDWQALVDACVLIGKERFAVEELDKWRDGGGAEAGGTNTPATALPPRFYTQIWDYFVHAKERVVSKAKMRKEAHPRPAPTTIAESSVRNIPPLTNARNSTAVNTNPAYAIDKIIDELRRLLQTFSTSSITAFSPPSESPANNPTKLPAYLPIDLDFTTPPRPPYSMSDLQQIYSSLLSTSPSIAAGQSPRYLGLGNTSDSDSITSTGFTVRELRFQNWVAINKLLFNAELHERNVEAKLHRGVAKQSPTGSQPQPQLKALVWKEEQIHEWVKQIKTQARSEADKGLHVDVDVRTGRISVKNEQERQELRKKMIEETWNIRTIVGGGGLAWDCRDEKSKEGNEKIEGKRLEKGGEIVKERVEDKVEEKFKETKEAEHEAEQAEKVKVKGKEEEAEKVEQTQAENLEEKLKETIKETEKVEKVVVEKLKEVEIEKEEGKPKRVETEKGEGVEEVGYVESVVRLKEKQKKTKTGKEEVKAEVKVRLKEKKEKKEAKKLEKADKLEKPKKKKETGKKVGKVGEKLMETIPVAQEEGEKAEKIERLEVITKETEEAGKEWEEAGNTQPTLLVSPASLAPSPTPSSLPKSKTIKIGDQVKGRDSRGEGEQTLPAPSQPQPQPLAVSPLPPTTASPAIQPIGEPTLAPTPSLRTLTPNSSITQTVTEIPRSSPPSPEQLQQAMLELSAISEAEIELADSVAELFTLTAQISHRRNAEQASRHQTIPSCGENQSRVETTSPHVISEGHQSSIVVEAEPEPDFASCAEGVEIQTSLEARYASSSSISTVATVEAKPMPMNPSILTPLPQEGDPNPLDPTPTSNLESNTRCSEEGEEGEDEGEWEEDESEEVEWQEDDKDDMEEELEEEEEGKLGVERVKEKKKGKDKAKAKAKATKAKTTKAKTTKTKITRGKATKVKATKVKAKDTQDTKAATKPKIAKATSKTGSTAKAKKATSKTQEEIKEPKQKGGKRK